MTTMPMWKWKRDGQTKLLFRSNKLRTELLLAVAELDVFTEALRCEMNRIDDEEGLDVGPRPTDQP